jgi:hypothetical protein
MQRYELLGGMTGYGGVTFDGQEEVISDQIPNVSEGL